jgi:aryl-alcohol dehydrogenase-like predicted oxidoreductase
MPLSIAGRPDSEDEAIRVIHAAVAGGATLIDTADVYCLDDDEIGHNERLIAKALRHLRREDRERVLVATKGGLTRPRGDWVRRASPEHLRRACERSLKALGVEGIDLYQLHAPDHAVPFLESVGALAELQREGKIRWIGLSNVSVDEIEAASRQVTVVTVQNRLNPFFREALSGGVVRHCERKGIGFLAYSPLGGGRLNRRLPSLPSLRPIAARHGISPHAVVLAWVLAQGGTVFVIPGARTAEHAADSLTAADIVLDETELDAIDRAEFPRA